MKVGHSMCERTQVQRALEAGGEQPIPRLLTSPRQWWNFRGCKLWGAGTFLFVAGNVAK